MKSREIPPIAIVLFLATQLYVLTALAQTKSAAVELEGAIAKEQVDGDLNAAIAAYQKIAADNSAPRELRAKALLHLAGCYEKLGKQAQSVYQQIVRDFGDQPAAVRARARLAAIKQADRTAVPATMSQRKIEILSNWMAPGDTDGHRVVYLKEATGELIYGDLAGSRKRVIFKAKPDELFGYWPSKDFSMVMLQFKAKPKRPRVFAVMKMDGTGYREVFHDDEGGISFRNWSWDNRFWLVVQKSPNGNDRLMVISVADGKSRELVSLKAAAFDSAAFSPDGRFVVYRTFSSQFAYGDTFRIVVVSIKSGDSATINDEKIIPGGGGNSFLLDWTADGRYLATVLLDHATKRTALYLLPVKDGQPAGKPIFVRYTTQVEGSTTVAGALIYTSIKPGGLWKTHLASIDSNGRIGLWQQLSLMGAKVNGDSIDWGLDGNHIIYSAQNEDQSDGGAIVLRDVATGEDREIYHALNRIRCVWPVEHARIFCTESSDSKNRTELFSIAVESGKIDPIHTFSSGEISLVQPSPHGRSLYIFDHSERGYVTLLRWDVAASQETWRERFSYESGTMEVWPSEDECWLLRLNGKDLQLRAISGGDWRSITSLNSEVIPGYYVVDFTPDGNWLFYLNKDASGKLALFRVSTAGGASERVGDFPSEVGNHGILGISPDGHRIFAQTGYAQDGFEMWCLENFVPPAPKNLK